MQNLWQRTETYSQNGNTINQQPNINTFNSSSHEPNYTQQPVNYNLPIRESVNCITIDSVDWKDLKEDISGLNFKASMFDWPSIFFGLAIPVTLEIFYLAFSDSGLDIKEVVVRLIMSIVLICIGLIFKISSKAKHPEALEENLKTLNNRVKSIERKCPTTDISENNNNNN